MDSLAVIPSCTRLKRHKHAYRYVRVEL